MEAWEAKLLDELKRAGFAIEHYKTPGGAEFMVGLLHGWSATRGNGYWICKGPGIPPAYAESLHKKFGSVVRVDGHCCRPSPREWFNGFAVGHYHVDTGEGLLALADTIRQVAEDAKKPPVAIPQESGVASLRDVIHPGRIKEITDAVYALQDWIEKVSDGLTGPVVVARIGKYADSIEIGGETVYCSESDSLDADKTTLLQHCKDHYIEYLESLVDLRTGLIEAGLGKPR